MSLNILDFSLGKAPADKPPLYILHGLFGSAKNWGAIARQLVADRPVFGIDMPNHGDSPHSDSQDYQDMANLVGEAIQAHSGGMEIDLLGHSMGGKTAMWMTLERAVPINKLIVADISPVQYDHSHADKVDAMRNVDLENVKRRADMDAALAQGIDDPVLRSFLLQNVASGPNGYRWKLNLDVLERDMDLLFGFPMTHLHDPWEGDALFLRGAASDYVLDEHEPVIDALFPNADHHAIAEAGHWLHAQKPAEVTAALKNFLD